MEQVNRESPPPRPVLSIKDKYVVPRFVGGRDTISIKQIVRTQG